MTRSVTASCASFTETGSVSASVTRLTALAGPTISTVAGSAFGVSDGNYTPERQHCSGAANNVESPTRAEEGCHNGTITIRDVAGHEYFGIGSAQTVPWEKPPLPMSKISRRTASEISLRRLSLAVCPLFRITKA